MTPLLSPPPETLLALCQAGAVCPSCGVPPPEGAVVCAAHERVAVSPEARRYKAEAPLLGHVIAERYALVDRVGGGGMGVVYRGVDLRLERIVAVKTLHGFMATGEEQRMRFEREARALSALTSDHTVTVFDYGTVHDGPLTGLGYIVMELIAGESLEDRLEVGPLPPEEAVQVLTHVARSLAEAHDMGIVHRDLKPSNILLAQTHGGRLKAQVIDFGIARMEGSSRTRSGVIMGTPHYMAPEQCSGENAAIDARTDVYALGVVLYEMLVGAPPFDAPEALQVVLKQVSVPPPHLPQRGEAGAPPRWVALDAVVQRALAKDPEARFPSVRALVEAATHASGMQVMPLEQTPQPRPAPSARPPTLPTPRVVGEIAPAPEPEPELTRERRSPGAILWVGAGVAAVAVTLLGWWAQRGETTEEAPSVDASVVVMRVGAPTHMGAGHEASVVAPEADAFDAALPDAAPPDEGVADAAQVVKRPARRARKRRGPRRRAAGKRGRKPAARDPGPTAEVGVGPPSGPSGEPPNREAGAGEAPLVQPLLEPLIDE